LRNLKTRGKPLDIETGRASKEKGKLGTVVQFTSRLVHFLVCYLWAHLFVTNWQPPAGMPVPVNQMPTPYGMPYPLPYFGQPHPAYIQQQLLQQQPQQQPQPQQQQGIVQQPETVVLPPLTATSLANVEPEVQRAMLGERLYVMISTMESDLAGKITGFCVFVFVAVLTPSYHRDAS
jgi:hypothetical protein